MNIYFNLMNKSLADLTGVPLISTVLPFRMNLGCPGQSTKATVVVAGSTLVDITNYSICNEDEVGMNLLLIVNTLTNLLLIYY